jgi:3-phosphoglycerate kinase
MKNKLRSIKQVDLKNRHVVLRVDFNVPVKNGKVQDDYKIKRSLPTIKYLLKNKCKIVVISHFSRPEGKRVKAMSLEPVYKEFKRNLARTRTQFVTRKIDENLVKHIDKLYLKNDIVMLENIRYDKRENQNRKNLAQLLAKMGEVYVNEAFATSHRENSSTVGITEYLPSYAGLNFENEVAFLSKALEPKEPDVALVGGAKVKTKLQVIKNFLKLYQNVMIGGGLANTFLAAKGYDVGGSFHEPAEIKNAKKLLKSKKLLLPIDVVVADNSKPQIIKVVKVGKQKKLCNLDEQILDIGPETVQRFSREIKKAKTIVWGGPFGYLEDKRFSHGTISIAKIIGARSSGRAVSIAGGGETLLAIHMSKMERYYDFISTGGSAMLKFLEGKKLPGIQSLIKNKKIV